MNMTRDDAIVLAAYTALIASRNDDSYFKAMTRQCEVLDAIRSYDKTCQLDDAVYVFSTLLMLTSAEHAEHYGADKQVEYHAIHDRFIRKLNEISE